VATAMKRTGIVTATRGMAARDAGGGGDNGAREDDPAVT